MLNGFDNLATDQNRTDRLISRTEPFGNCDQIRCHGLLFAGEQCTGAAHSAHHFIGNPENAVTIADLANPPEISGSWGQTAGGCTNDRFSDESGDPLRAYP